MKTGYDKIAWCYDVLSYLVFGNSIKKAQTYLLKFIPAGARILIAGGGTGWILEKIAQVHSSGLFITYTDASERMIGKSKKRYHGSNELKFIAMPIEEVIIEPGSYDVLITPFFFDNFPQSKCSLIFQQLDTSLKRDGIWLFSDFKANSRKFWQKHLLKIMYLFFRAVCGLEASQLPEMDNYFTTCGYKKIAQKMYYKRFIIAEAFKKP